MEVGLVLSEFLKCHRKEIRDRNTTLPKFFGQRITILRCRSVMRRDLAIWKIAPITDDWSPSVLNWIGDGSLFEKITMSFGNANELFLQVHKHTVSHWWSLDRYLYTKLDTGAGLTIRENRFHQKHVEAPRLPCRVDYNSVCIGDKSEILEPHWGFSGSANLMVYFKLASTMVRKILALCYKICRQSHKGGRPSGWAMPLILVTWLFSRKLPNFRCVAYWYYVEASCFARWPTLSIGPAELQRIFRCVLIRTRTHSRIC